VSIGATTATAPEPCSLRVLRLFALTAFAKHNAM
jgi:hypothetical protein